MLRVQKVQYKDSWEKFYEFVSREFPNWKTNYVISCTMENKAPIEQGELSDFQFFCSTKQNQEIYLFFEDNRVVTFVLVQDRNGTTKDISFFTAKDEQHKGYATQAVKLIEKMIFMDKKTAFTSIVDLSNEHYSSKIAEKLGYSFLEEQGFYLKANPYLKEQQIIALLMADKKRRRI